MEPNTTLIEDGVRIYTETGFAPAEVLWFYEHSKNKFVCFYAEISDDITKTRILTGFLDYRKIEGVPALTFAFDHNRKASVLKSTDMDFFLVASLLHRFHPDMDIFPEMRILLKEEWERLTALPDEERDDYTISECKRMMEKFGATA